MFKNNKYNNKKTYIDGIEFDSKKEAKRYVELKEMERLGAITELVLQPVFVLQDKFKKNGMAHRAIKYIADFSYFSGQQVIIEDVKGVKTDVFKIKQKLFEFKYPELVLTIV